MPVRSLSQTENYCKTLNICGIKILLLIEMDILAHINFGGHYITCSLRENFSTDAGLPSDRLKSFAGQKASLFSEYYIFC